MGRGCGGRERRPERPPQAEGLPHKDLFPHFPDVVVDAKTGHVFPYFSCGRQVVETAVDLAAGAVSVLEVFGDPARK